jgi:hypothetical protein
MRYASIMKTTQHARRKAFWSAFWCGMAAPGLLFAADGVRITRVEARHVGVRDAMRGDWIRIGEDFQRVIAREEAATDRQ